MERFWRYQFRRTSLLLTASVSLLLGVGSAHIGYVLPPSMPVLLAVWFLLAARKHRFMAVVAVAALGFTVGCWRGALYQHQLNRYRAHIKHPVVADIIALDDGVYGKRSQIEFTGGSVVLNGQKLAGRIQVSGYGLGAVSQGDHIVGSGRLSAGRGANQANLQFAYLELRSHNASPITRLRQRFTAAVDSALPEPLASFAMGLLIGQRSTLDAGVKQDLLMVGLTHIVAVSGYNLTIILHAGRKLLGHRSKRIGTWLSLALIGVFLLLAGASASIVRAAIVSTLSIYAAYYGRSFRPLNLICLAAAITAYMSPFYVWGDMSWYLSFLAFYGILVLAPAISAKLPKRLAGSLLVSVAIESISAEMMTLPIILFTFGQMSLMGLPANVLITTLVPLAMLLSFVAGLAGMFVAPLAGWIAWPAMVLLNYMLDLAHILSHVRHVFLQNLQLSLANMLMLYGLITALSLLLYRKTKPPIYATITDRNEWSQQMVND